MATNPEHGEAANLSPVDVSDIEAMKKGNQDDDFVILERFQGLSDSGMSSASTILEKQSFKSLEKNPQDDSILGASAINEQPYYEDNRFLDNQHHLERKRGYFGWSGGEDGQEKNDETPQKEKHVEELPYQPWENDQPKHSPEEQTAEPSTIAEIQEPRETRTLDEQATKDVGKKVGVEGNETRDAPSEEQNSFGEKPSSVAENEASPEGSSKMANMNETGSLGLKQDIAVGTKVREQAVSNQDPPFPGNSDGKPSSNNETAYDDRSENVVNEKQKNGHESSRDNSGTLLSHDDSDKSQETDDAKMAFSSISERPADDEDQNDDGSDSETTGFKVMPENPQNGDETARSNSSEEDGSQTDPAEGQRSSSFHDGEDDGTGDTAGFSGGGQNQNDAVEAGTSLRRRAPRGANDPPANEIQEPHRNEQVNQNPGIQVGYRRGRCCSTVFLILKLLIMFLLAGIFILMFLTGILILLKPVNRSPHKPVVQIQTKKHLPPNSSLVWKLQGNCHAYNSTYTITVCQWRQIHPKPTNPNNTVLPNGYHSCLQGSPSHIIDATLDNLKVPKEPGNYIFELHCADNTDNTNEERVDIWVNELIPPIITLDKTEIVTSTSVDSVPLPKASCRAVQGKVVSAKWDFIDGPEEINTPADGGDVKFDSPGKYRFMYKCVDSYDASAYSTVVVIAKPPYVLGIDLGTSTTCVVFIKEDGTSQDIYIYDKDDESETDPCMPSIVAFGHDGQLLIGEKALRQAVENPSSTIYEVKRLMGRSYYDDADHKFVYKVRPTLKSHSLKGVRAAIEIPCQGTNKLIQPELVSALILRRVADIAEEYLDVPVKDVVISVPAQFDDAQRKATMDAGLIAGLNPIKIVNEPTVAAFAARNITEAWLQNTPEGNPKNQQTIWAVVADIGGGTTDFALMQIKGNSYKVVTTDGNKTLGGRDIDIHLAKKMTELFWTKYPGLDLRNTAFQQRLRIECENAKIVLSEKEQYSLTIDYTDDEQEEPLPLEHLLTRFEFESYISEILKAMTAPLDSLIARSGGLNRGNIEDLYLVGGTSNIPKLKEMLKNYFSKVKNVYHKDPVQLVSRGAAAFGAALTRLVEIQNLPKIDVTPLPISIAVDNDEMHVIFERNRLYPCIEYPKVSTFADHQTAIMIKVYEGDGRTADECHFLGEFELSGIPALPKGIPEINTRFRIDSNGILSVKATHGLKETAMKLDVYSKSGSMTRKTRNDLSLLLSKLTSRDSNHQFKCSLLESASPMEVIPPRPKKENVLKLSVDSEYDSVEMVNASNPTANLAAVGMIAVNGFVTDQGSSKKESDLDIVLVIDKSGSMEGTPLHSIKKVIESLVGYLKNNHRLGIVTYDSYVYRRMELNHCTHENKQRARDIVRGIQADGQTNLYGGLSTGLHMAYHGARRCRVLLFTDGYANVGWRETNDIIREILREITNLSPFTTAEVQLSTFGYLGNHDEFLLQKLATHVGGGTYNYLKEDSAFAESFGHVLADAINIVAEKIQLTVTPLSGVQVMKAITNFSHTAIPEGMKFEIPSTANQQARHILLQLAVPPTQTKTPHDSLLRVELTYTNTITEREEGCEEYLFVARTRYLDKETRSREVDEQLNRVLVADTIGKALEYLKQNNRLPAVDLLKEAQRFVSNSISKEHTLSLCLRLDLAGLISEIENGDLNEAKKALQDSLTSHWQEKGGRSSCYLTKKEDKLITILKN